MIPSGLSITCIEIKESDPTTNLIKRKSMEVNLLEKFMEGFSTRKAGTKRLQEQRFVLDLDFEYQVRSSNIKLKEFKYNRDSNLSTALSPCCLKIGSYRCLKVLVADAAVFVNIHLLQSHINQVLTKISIKSCTTRKSSELQSCGWLSRRTRKLIESSNYILNTTCIQYYMDAENDKVGTND